MIKLERIPIDEKYIVSVYHVLPLLEQIAFMLRAYMRSRTFSIFAATNYYAMLAICNFHGYDVITIRSGCIEKRLNK